MIIVYKDPQTYAPDFLFREILTGSVGSESATFEHGDGVLANLTLTGEVKSHELVNLKSETLTVTEVSGTADISLVRVANVRASKLHRLDTAIAGGSTVPILKDHAAGSLGAITWDIVKTKLDAVGVVKPLFSGGDGGNVNVGTVYNSACWASSFDFSGVSFRNSETGGTRRTATAITRRHVICTKHFAAGVGAVLSFRAPDNSVVQATVISRGWNGSETNGGNGGEIMVCLLDSELPPKIASYPLVGEWAYEWLTFGGKYELVYFFSALSLDQSRNVHHSASVSLNDFHLSSETQSVPNYVIFNSLNPSDHDFSDQRYEPFSGYSQWSNIPVPGDSGNPLFIPLSANTMAIITTFTTPYSGAFFGASLINSLIVKADTAAGISTGLTVTVAPDPTI